MWRREAVLGMRLSLKTVASLKSMDIRKEYGAALLARLTEYPPAFSFSHICDSESGEQYCKFHLTHLRAST